MFLIDQPFVSPFLIETIKKNHFPIIATKAARSLVSDEELIWIKEEEAIATLKANPQIPLYSNSENALAWIAQNLEELELSQQVLLLKDKFRFRKMIKSLFPAFFYKEVKLEDIQTVSLQEIPFPFVIKPSVGFFSIGVYIINNEEDWIAAKKELLPERLSTIFPKNVLDVSNFIIEEFIVGEEYAIDYYYDENGTVVILNILHHLFSSGTDTSDRVYTTSKTIIETYEKPFAEFLEKIGKELGLKNFVAHAEVRIDENGQIMPIEINPLRFGGWCTTGDLLGITLGFNAYKCFYKGQKPNWDTIFNGKENKKFSIVILDNSTGSEPSIISDFDYSMLAQEFENPVLIRKLDIHKYPVFGFVFTETSPENEAELDRILVSDLKRYIHLK